MSKKKTENLYITENGTIRLRNKAGNSSNAELANQVLFFPTPVASDGTTGAIIGKNDTFKMTKGLPRKINQNGKDGSLGLARLVQFLPTPTTQDAKNNGSQSQQERNTLPLNVIAGGKLNPEWVEWLMGYPEGWTDLKD